MRDETAAYLAERIKLATQPIYQVIWQRLANAIDPNDEQFPESFVSAEAPWGVPVIRCIESITGGPSQIFPEQGRASHGNMSLKLVDPTGRILQYFQFDADFEIRPGVRAVVLAGYQGLAGEDFMFLGTFQVENRRAEPFTDPAFVVDLVDITRSTRSEVFLAATPLAPFILSGHPIDIALQILLSGNPANSNYNTLGIENGLQIPERFIDVEAFEAIRDEMPNDFYCFEIMSPENAKNWLETEIYKTINAYPVIRQVGQDSKLSLRLYRPVIP
jgi:hypothetical protein